MSNPTKWTTSEVITWLRTAVPVLVKYEHIFRSYAIDGPFLLTLNDECINNIFDKKNEQQIFKCALNELIDPQSSQPNVQQQAATELANKINLSLKLPSSNVIRINNISENSTISCVKQIMMGRDECIWENDKLQLSFNNIVLQFEKTLQQSNITNDSVIQVDLVKVLPDGHPLVVLSYKPDVITFDDDTEFARAEMICGHVIGPDSLTAYVRSIANNPRQIKITCPGFKDDKQKCAAEWEWQVCRIVGQFTNDECKEFELKFARKASKEAYGHVKECPVCHSNIYKPPQLKQDRIRCSVCLKYGNNVPDFCWSCLKSWKSSNNIKCGNEDCTINGLNEVLRECQLKDIGANKNVPDTRACPNCRTLISHIDRCKHIDNNGGCPGCKLQFCFVCLKPKLNGQWQCGKYTDQCSEGVAPRQQFS